MRKRESLSQLHLMNSLCYEFHYGHAQVSLHRYRSALLRNMVNSGHLRERATATLGSLLGNRLGQVSRRNEDSDDNGLSFCQGKLCLYVKETSGSELGLPRVGIDIKRPLLDARIYQSPTFNLGSFTQTYRITCFCRSYRQNPPTGREHLKLYCH